jgi:hypothetical protein
MLDSNMKEASSLRIPVEDVDLVSMERFLHFVYTAELPEEKADSEADIESLGQLASIADKYGVPHLVDVCVHKLKQWVNSHHVLAVLQQAQKLSHQDLKQFCLEYATTDKHLEIVYDSQLFETLEAVLVRDLLVYHAGACKRRRANGFEFPDGADWRRLTYVQLQRACHERGFPAWGDKGVLLVQLAGASEEGIRKA